MIAYLTERYRQEELERDELFRADPALRGRYDNAENHDIAASELRDRWEEAQVDPKVAVNLCSQVAEQLAAKLGKRFDQTTVEYRRLCMSLLSAMIGVYDTKVERDNGHYIVTNPISEEATRPFRALRPDSAHSSAAERVVATGAISRTVADLIAAFLKDREPHWAATTAGGFAPVFRLLREVVGEGRAVSSVTREEARELTDLLQRLPANLGKHRELRRLTIPQAIDRAEALGLPRLNPKTINDNYITNLRSVFGWATAEGWIKVNPFAKLAVSDPVDDADRRDPFSREQLKALFSAAPWHSRAGATGALAVRFWLPLICLFHGLRLAEAAALRVDDLETVDGMLVMHIRPTADRRLKTAHSRRSIPVHPELLKMGFAGFIAGRKDSGAEQLFHGMRADSRGRWGRKVSEWFTAHIAARGFDGRKLGMHSFRHNFQDALREAGLHGTGVGQELAGRARSSTVSGAYGTGYALKDLAEAIGKVRYTFLDLSHLA